MVNAASETGASVGNLVIVLIGVALLAVSAWAWAGRSRRARWWTRSPLGPNAMLGVIPGLGLLLTCVGLLVLFDLANSSISWLLVPGFLVGVLLELAGMFYLPGWLGPRWYRRLSKQERDRLVTSGRSPTAASLAVLAGRPDTTSATEARKRFGRAKPLVSWRAGYVYDPDTGERTHGMSRKGTVDGRLTVFTRGVVFTASKWEDTLRGKTTVLIIDTDQITGARVVPPRAGADGRPRKGRLYRSWFPRLVIDTPTTAHVFDIARGHAKQAAAQLSRHGGK